MLQVFGPAGFVRSSLAGRYIAGGGRPGAIQKTLFRTGPRGRVHLVAGRGLIEGYRSTPLRASPYLPLC